jgi:hypothetical protein
LPKPDPPLGPADIVDLDLQGFFPALGRLPRRQRDVIHGYFFEERDVPELAAAGNVSESTIYNQKSVAQKTFHDDDVFFSVLFSLAREDRVWDCQLMAFWDGTGT